MVFKLDKEGAAFEILHNFDLQNGDGPYPIAGLVEGGDGAVYGTTSSLGGDADAGTVFRLNKNGSAFIVLRRFSWPQEPGSEDGSLPQSALVRGSDGMLYGTTPLGGDKDFGVVFRLNLDGSNYAVVHSFGDGPSDANNPGPLIEASDGLLYGTAAAAGSNSAGAVFKLKRDGTGYSLLRRFSWLDGGGPNQASLIEGVNGALYGTTDFGVSNYAGSIFKMNKDGSGYAIIRTFGEPANDGSNPRGLARGSDGYIYGTTIGGGSNNAGTVFKMNGDGGDYSVLRHFAGTDGDGASPQTALLEGSDGRLYGTTAYGGLNGAGTVFTMNKDGSGYTILRRFIVGEDGGYPFAALTEASDGALYGENAGGGSKGSGTVFKLGRDGSGYVVLHAFGGDIADGSWPSGGLVEGNDGSLCGTTVSGGLDNGGTAFKLNKDGSSYTVLHHFGGADGDGSGPNNGLLKGSDGMLYATTYYGGDMGFGTVFKLFSTPPQITITRVEVRGSGTQLSFSGGAAGQACQIQASTHLSPTVDWQTIGSSTAAIDGRFKFIDTGASNYPSRIYRTATP